ncbi:MAG TPA: DMT family transporter [Lacunisphaera sp.]|nr:DMT family transporter [Lacunisphaera sp.]
MTSPNAQRHRRAVSLMLLSAASFTANVLLVRALGTMVTTNIWLVSCTRFVVGLAMTGTVYWREFAPGHLFTRRKLMERGIAGGIGVYLTYLTVVKLGAGRATFIGNTYVVWGAMLAAWMLRERLRPADLLGGVAAVLGIGLLTNVFSVRVHPGIYDLLAVVGSLLSAWVVVTIRQLHETEHTSTIFAAQCAYGLVICLVPAIETFAPLSAGAWALLVLAGLTAGSGQLAMTRAFRDLPVAEGSLIQMLVPLGIAVGGMVFFGERFAPYELVGAALILGGTAYSAVHHATTANAEAE